MLHLLPNSQVSGTDPPVANKKSRADTYNKALSTRGSSCTTSSSAGGKSPTANAPPAAEGGLALLPADPAIRGKTSSSCAAPLTRLQDANLNTAKASALLTSSHKGDTEVGDDTQECLSVSGGTATSQEDSLSQETEASTEEEDSSDSGTD